MTAAREQFDAWLDVMDASIAAFVRDLPPEVAARLDGSPESLEALEAWLLERYPSPEAMRPEPERYDVDGAARYFGEVLRRELGGSWDLEDGNDRALFAGVPVLRGVGVPGGPPVAPLYAVSAAADRRTGRFLSDMLGSLRAAGGTR